MILANRNAINHYILMTIHIYKSLSLSVRQSVCHVLFVPRGTNISDTQERWGQTFLTHRREGGGANIFTLRGEQTFYVGGDDAYDDVDEEIDLSEANFPASEANILVSEVSKPSAGARTFRGL